MLELQQKENKKNALGQFFTKQNVWLKPQVLDFIKYTKTHIAYDPFAGDGDLLEVAKNLGYKKIIGLDIDPTLEKKWIINDSLVYIPKIDDAIIITNPPFLHKSSAKRKGIRQQVSKYFDNSAYIDLYLIALDKALKAVKYVVAIVPETFINSNFEHMNRLTSITVLEENPFEDTEVPVCVVTFDDKEKDFSKVKVFKNDRFVNDFYTISKHKLKPCNCVEIKFNDEDGWLALRAIDTTKGKKIKFGFREEFEYDWEKNLKKSSRSYTLISIDVEVEKRKLFIEKLNELLEEIRSKTEDIILTPFKGNDVFGKRRRRLDYKTARALLETINKKMYYKKERSLQV